MQQKVDKRIFPRTDHRSGEEDVIIPSTSGAYRFFKRTTDVLCAALLLLLFSPLMLLIAALVRLTSPGPAMFKQVRAGMNNEPFTMFKFRSMHQGAQDDREYLADKNETDGPVFKISADPRLTVIGRFLRRSSLDELPQLLNVLRGEMSLIGPRPLWFPEAERVEGSARLRTCVKPGLTGLWQVSGRSELGYEEWIGLDLIYIANRSVWLDLLILFHTVPAVLTGHGAY